MAKSIGANLDALRNKRREEEEEQKKVAGVGASLDALRNKRQTEDLLSFEEALYNEKGFLQNQAARSASAEIPDITTPAGKQSVTSMIDRTLPRPGQKISAVDAPLATPTKTKKNLGTYGLQNFGAGFLSGTTSGVNAAENVLTDVVTGGERSGEMKKIDDYLKTDRGAYDALMSGDPLTEAPTRANIAKKAGVSESAVKSYKTQGASEYWKTVADDWAEENELNAVTKFFLGDAAYQIGMQAPGMMLGAATPFGQSSSSLVESVVDSVKGKSGKDLLKAVGKGTVSGLKSAAKGNTTTWIMAANSAGSKFFENQRLYGDEVSVTTSILDSAANGFLESFTEGLGGFSDLPSVGRVLESTVGSKTGTIMRTGLKALLGMVEEGAEEIINVPLGGLADKMTVAPEKKWFGDGGVFDGKEMLVSGMQGALIGGLMGGAGVVAAVNSALAKPDTAKTENAWTANRLADTMNPSEIQLATEMLNSEAEHFGVEKLDAKKATREDIENTSAQILDKIIEVKDADILSRRDQLIDYALAAPTDSETYRVGQTLAANPEAVTARDLSYLVHAETERIKQAEASVPAEAVAEAESLVPQDAPQTEAQVISADVQNTVRGEQVQQTIVSAENGGATVATDLAIRLRDVAPKKANLAATQKLADAVRLIQSGTMPDKSYNEVFGLLKSEPVRRTVEMELLTDAGKPFRIDAKNANTIRTSLSEAVKTFANLSAQADMDTLSEEISHAVSALPSYQSPARQASDVITIEGGVVTRADFVQQYGAALEQQGLAADAVFDNLLAAERDVNMTASTVSAPNGDVNAIDRDVNSFEHEANAPYQSEISPVSAASNADANATASNVSRETLPNGDANAIEHDANAITSTASASNGDANAINRDVNSFEHEANADTVSRVHRDFSPEKPLSEIQSESIRALEMLSRAVNVDIHLYDSAEDGAYSFSSGRYDTRADRIYVDINAGANYEGTILRTAAHELTHYIKRWSPESFSELSDFVVMALEESGADIDALAADKKATAERHGGTLSDDAAYEEVIADACQMLLTDSDALYRLSEQNKTLFERVMDFFREFLDNLRSVYAGYKPTTEAGRVMAEQTQDVMDMLSEVYADALIRAGKARTEAQQMLSGQESAFDAAKTEQGEVLFDYRAMRDDMSRYEQMLTQWGGMPKADVDRLMGLIGHTVDVVRENRKKLDYGYDSDPNAERPFHPVKINSDNLYKISIDFSTLCRKRIVQAIVAENLERALIDRTLTKEEHIEIRNALAEVQREAKTVEVACALCYVEAARLKTPAQVDKTLRNLPSVLFNYYASKDAFVKKAVADAEEQAKQDRGIDPATPIKAIKDKGVRKIVRDAKKAALKTYSLTDAQKAEIEYAASLPYTAFTTSRGLTDLAQNHFDVYKAYADAIRAASRSKGLESDVPWRAGDSETSVTDGLIRRMNEGAGVRSQSWSDFQVIHLLDEIAMTIEMATRGAKMHSYTKVPDYVRLLGQTGHMINMSLIPTRDGEGFDAVEGMPYEVMLALRDQYPDTAGNICIGVNDTQILRLLESDEIDYVIPYHHSGNSIAVRRALKIPEWSSYQDIQSEKGGDGPTFAEWFDLNRARETAARENANPTDPAAKEKYGVQYGAYKAMQEAADHYLQICAERGLTPKFKGKVEGRNVDFTTHPNYWKLLIDRKMVNQITGEVIEQKPVQPIFDPAVIYGDPADGNVGGILGRALAEYDVRQADTAYAVEKVTRAMAEKVGADSDIVEPILGESVEDIRNGGILFDYRISSNEASAPHTSERDIASSPEFEAFVKAYDAVHGEGAARTIVRTTEQFDRERARQRKREATAAQMARLPETEAKLLRMTEAAERSRKDMAKINAIKNPAVRRAKQSAHLSRQQAENIRHLAELDAQMRVADQAYRDNVEMQDRLAEQKARAEERLRGVKADYQERLDRERVRTAQAKFEGKQNASERVQRERYKQWWRNRIHEEDLRQARAEGRENVRQARAEERARAAERAKEVRDYRAFRNRNADVINEQRQNRHNTYPTGEGAIGNMIDRKQAAYNERAAREQADFEQEYLSGQASAASRTGAGYVPGAPETSVKPYLSTADTSATPPGNTFKPVPTKTGKVVEAVKGLPEKAKQAGGTAYRLMVNSAQPLDDIAKKQEKAGFLATASDYVTSARNAPAVASYIIGEGLTDKSGNPIGKSLSDVVLVRGADDVTFGGETVMAQQAFQDYLLHKHNVDRMSFTVRAKQDLDALIEENPWIPDFVDETTSEFTRELYGLSEEQREIVARWADLNRRFREAEDKPIFPAENDTVWTAEQSQARVERYEREQPWLKDKAEDLYQWWDTFMREYAVGVSITAEEYEAMRTLYPHYVPTYREGKSLGKSTNAVAGSVSAGKAVHEATGGTSEVRWIQDTLAEQVVKIVGLQKQNELLLNLVDSAMLDSDGTMFPGLRVAPKSMGYSTLMTAEDLDNADHQTQTLSKNPDGTYTVTAWDNGNRVSVYVSEDVYNALFSMFGQRSKGYQLALTAGRKLSTPMKSMITGYNPAFGIRNAVRDVATGLIQAEGGTLSGMGSYAANYVRAWNQIASGSDAWNAFKAQGGAGSTHYRAEDGLSSQAEKMMSPGWFSRVKDFLGWFNETSESAARYAAYLQYLRTNGDTPENRIRAIHSAAEITTDFSRSGDIGKLLNAWVPYSNAATQGVDRVLRDFTQGKAINRLTRAAIVQGIPAAIIGLVVKGLGREDEYDEISDYHKDNYYLIPIPDGKWLRLPKTPLYGTLLTSGVSRAVEGVLGREDPFSGFGATAAEAFNIPGAGAESLPEAASSVVRDVVGIGPMLDLFMNKNFIGQDIVPSEFKDFSSGTYAPNSTQYNDETSAVAMMLSKMMLDAISPIQMDYLMKSYMGDFYHGIASILDVGLFRSFTAEDLGKNLFDATLGETGSSFVVDPVYSNRYTGEYYDMLDAMAAQIAADKVHMPEGEYKNTRTYLTKKAVEDKYGKNISAAYKTARSAVSEAQKRDAREEAVRLSIEALDFYDAAMAGKYGDDPSKYVEYEQYGEDVCEALLKLTPYEEEYSFEPNDSYAPSSLTVNKVKYELTAEQRDEYKAMYVSIYADLARQVISTTEYRTVGDRKKAEMLEEAASDAREEATARFKAMLSGK